MTVDLNSILESTEGEKAKPCPFCDCDKISIRYEGQPAIRYAYLCTACGASSGSVLVGGMASKSSVSFDNPEALALWNNRAPQR